MQLPNPGSLIGTLRANLKQSILPELKESGAQRQLKAALHLLGRLEKSWDLYAPQIIEDNLDIEQSLFTVLEQLKSEGVGDLFTAVSEGLSQLAQREVMPINGLNSPALILAAQHNMQLQQLVNDTQEIVDSVELTAPRRVAIQTLLTELYQRMVRRDAIANGDYPPVNAISA
ncbi:MAG: hypothetical protein WCY88_08315 [Spongiibacteraceae bacterium]